jgi:6-phosphogluconolactonase
MEFIVNYKSKPIMNMKPDIKILDDIESLNVEFTKLLKEHLWKKGELSIALSGGSTPKLLFDFWASNDKTDLDWSKIRFFWSDERCVSPLDDESNFKMTKDHLFNYIPVPEKNIYRIHGEEDPQKEAERYANVLKDNVEMRNGLPSFEVLMLGLGNDGHTASIFPHQIELWDSNDICVVGTHPDSGQKRISLSGKTINNAHIIVFLVTGRSKSEIVKEIVRSELRLDNKYPAAKVNPVYGKVVWFLDKKAANLLID